jgi:hypothetical protein
MAMSSAPVTQHSALNWPSKTDSDATNRCRTGRGIFSGIDKNQSGNRIPADGALCRFAGIFLYDFYLTPDNQSLGSSHIHEEVLIHVCGRTSTDFRPGDFRQLSDSSSCQVSEHAAQPFC